MDTKVKKEVEVAEGLNDWKEIAMKDIENNVKFHCDYRHCDREECREQMIGYFDKHYKEHIDNVIGSFREDNSIVLDHNYDEPRMVFQGKDDFIESMRKAFGLNNQ